MRKTLPATMSRLQGPGNIRQGLKHSKIPVPLSQQPRISTGGNTQEAKPSGYSPLPPPRPTLARLFLVHDKGVPLGSAYGDERYANDPNASVGQINRIMQNIRNPFTQYNTPITMKSMSENQHKQVTPIQNRTWSHHVTPKVPKANYELELSLDTAVAQLDALLAKSREITERIQILDEDLLEHEAISFADLDSSSYLQNSAVNAMQESRRYGEELQEELENEEMDLVDFDD